MAKMDGLEITQLARNPYSLGLITRYLSDHRPFADFDFGATIHALMFQIQQGTHLIATRNDAIVGYLGWLRVDPDIALAWAAGKARLVAHPDGASVAVTIFVADDPRDILPMIRAAKRAEPGRSVYWKRYFSDNRTPHARAVLTDTERSQP
jgi:hypothetical protein